MKSRAAVLKAPGEAFVIEEIEVDEPKHREVMVKIVASGVCHSDHHFVTGDVQLDPSYYPVVMGHEAAGIVEKVGSGVERFKPGDHVALAYIPACGHCRWCVSGLSNLCDQGGGALSGHLLDGTTRLHASDGSDISQFCYISTFSEYTTVPEDCCFLVADDLPLETVCLVGCGVPTGFGSAVHIAKTQPGDTVVVFGTGGVGMNAVQGAAIAGADRVVAVDLVESKLDVALLLGATHVVNATTQDPVAFVLELTRGVGADKAIVCAGVVTSELIGQAFHAVRKAGRVVVTGLATGGTDSMAVPPLELTLLQKEIVGAMFGGSNPLVDIPMLLDLYQSKKLQLEAMITRTYTLDEINDAFDDMLNGKNIRGVIVL